jgi:cytoskeleton protein RodZ
MEVMPGNATIGEGLRKLREERGYSLEQIAAETKIRARLLRAIEENDFDQLPGGVFRRSFVLQYAKYLGADLEEVMRELGELRPFQETPPVPGEVPGHVAPEISPLTPERDWSGLRTSLGSFLAVLGVVLVCATMYSWWRAENRSSLPAAQPMASAPGVFREPPPPAAAEPAASPAAKPEPASAPPSPAAGEAMQAAASVQVGLVAEELTWIQATSDGKRVFADALQANQTRTIEAADRVRLLIGNAGGVKIQLNGKELPQVGPRGQVRVVELRADGYEIVPRTPPTPEPL